MKNILSGFILLVSFFAMNVAGATTFYVRTDGGTAAQCNGQSDLPYSGNANCAFHHPFDALPPQGDGGTPTVLLHGGDTLVIDSGSYEMGIHAPGASAYPACNQGWSWDCFMANVPSGTVLNPTRIVGKGWDQGCSAPPELWGSERASNIISLAGSSNVTIACLNITDHSSCIASHLGGSSPLACNRSTAPYGNWASVGIKAKDSSNVTLQDLNIHGMANYGVLAGRLTDYTVTRVKLNMNGWGGWNNDLGESAGSSDHGAMTFRNLEIGWNGCGESYPDHQIVGCWGQVEGGYGDGFGSNTTSGNWTFIDSYFHNNTQDGLDLLYADTTATILVQRSHAEGNAGNQMKLSGSPSVENSLIVGDCSYFTGIDNMSGNNSGGAGTAGDQCRAMGNALVLSVQAGLHALVRYNTITSEGDCLILAINGNSTSSVAIQNNALVGKPAWDKADQSPQPQSCLFYWDSGPSSNWPVTYSGNLVYNVKDNVCPPGAGNLCGVDPRLANEDLFHFNPIPLAGSPLQNAANVAAGILSVDQRGLPRPAMGGYEIGAYQYQGSTDPGNTTGSGSGTTVVDEIFSNKFGA